MEDIPYQRPIQPSFDDIGLPASISRQLNLQGFSTLEDVLHQLAIVQYEEETPESGLHLGRSDMEELQLITVPYLLTTETCVAERNRAWINNDDINLALVKNRGMVLHTDTWNPGLDTTRKNLELNGDQAIDTATLTGDQQQTTAVSSIQGSDNIPDFAEQLRLVPIEVLELSVRSYNALQRQEFTTLHEVAHLVSEYKSTHNIPIRNMGEKGISEVIERFEQYLAEHKLEIPEIAEFYSDKHLYQVPIDVLNLPLRLQKKLMQNGINILADVAQTLKSYRTSGKLPLQVISIQEIYEIQAKFTQYLAEPTQHIATVTETKIDEQLRNLPVKVLDLSIRPHNALKRSGLNTLYDVAVLLKVYEETHSVPIQSMGEKGINEVIAKYAQYLAEHDQDMPDIEKSMELNSVPVVQHNPNPFDNLPERERLIVELRYSLIDGEEHTLDEIGSQMGLTRERIRQIISRFLKRVARWSQVAQTNEFEAALDKLGGLADDDEITSVLQPFADKLGYNPLGLARYIADFTEPQVMRMRNSAQTIWLLNRPMRDKWFLYLTTSIREVLEARRDFCTPSELTQVLMTRSDCPKGIEQTFIGAFIRIDLDLVKNDDGCIGLEIWGRNRTSICIAALRRIGEPAHFSHIAAVINETVTRENAMTPHNVHAAVLRQPDIFARVGQGTYGLVEWGLQTVEFYTDIIEKILRESGHPLSIQEVFTKVCEVRDCKEVSVIMYLTTGAYGRFKPFPNGLYGLNEWNEEEYTNLSHRTKRLMDSIDDDLPPTKLKPKPEVMKSLADIDDLFDNVRVYSSNPTGKQVAMDFQ